MQKSYKHKQLNKFINNALVSYTRCYHFGFLKINKMSEFKNKAIQKGSGKDFFLICKILEKLDNREEIDFIRDYIEMIAISNQECIRLLENIHYNSVSISQAE